MDELDKMHNQLTDLGPVAPKYRNEKRKTNIVDDKITMKCACDKVVRILEMPRCHSGIIPFVDNICPGCEDQAKGLAPGLEFKEVDLSEFVDHEKMTGIKAGEVFVPESLKPVWGSNLKKAVKKHFGAKNFEEFVEEFEETADPVKKPLTAEQAENTWSSVYSTPAEAEVAIPEWVEETFHEYYFSKYWFRSKNTIFD